MSKINITANKITFIEPSNATYVIKNPTYISNNKYNLLLPKSTPTTGQLVYVENVSEPTTNEYDISLNYIDNSSSSASSSSSSNDIDTDLSVQEICSGSNSLTSVSLNHSGITFQNNLSINHKTTDTFTNPSSQDYYFHLNSNNRYGFWIKLDLNSASKTVEITNYSYNDSIMYAFSYNNNVMEMKKYNDDIGGGNLLSKFTINSSDYTNGIAYILVMAFSNTNGSNSDSLTINVSSFTGQHHNKFLSNSISSNDCGKIVSSTGILESSNSFDHGYCKVNISQTYKDKTVYGVLSQYTIQNIYINSLGEGSIYVINYYNNNNDNIIENGDYLISSGISGFACKQIDDDILHNYTVAKATSSCDFTSNNLKYITLNGEWINPLMELNSTIDKYTEEQLDTYLIENGRTIENKTKLEKYNELIYIDLPSQYYSVHLLTCTYHCG